MLFADHVGICVPCPEKRSSINIRGKEVKTVKTVRYVGSLFDANGGVETGVYNRITIGWSKWRVVRQEHANKVCKKAIKAAMVYGAECWAVIKKKESKLHTIEMRMLRWGDKRKDMTRSCEKCIHLHGKSHQHVIDGRIPQREEGETVRTWANAG